MSYIIGQSLMVIAVVLGFISYQMKSQEKLLMLQCATGTVFVFHYLLIGGFAGMAMNIVGIVRVIVYIFRLRRGSNEIVTPIIFAILQAVSCIIGWDDWYSIFVFFGIVLNTLAFALPKAELVRRSVLITSPLVIIYDVFVMSIGGIVYESIAVISSFIGILREKKPDAAEIKAAE